MLTMRSKVPYLSCVSEPYSFPQMLQWDDADRHSLTPGDDGTEDSGELPTGEWATERDVL